MRVTIGQLVEDTIPFTDKGDEAMQIEIVPRKLVEDIIELCLKLGEENYDEGNNLASCDIAEANKRFLKSRTYEFIAQFAHELLEKFEGEDEPPHVCRYCKHAQIVDIESQLYGCANRSCIICGHETCGEWKERTGNERNNNNRE